MRLRVSWRPASSPSAYCFLMAAVAVLASSCTAQTASGDQDAGVEPRTHLVTPAASGPSAETVSAVASDHRYNTGAPNLGPDPACAGGAAALGAFPEPRIAWQAYVDGVPDQSDFGLAAKASSLLVGTSSTEFYQLDRRTGAYVWQTEAWYGPAMANSDRTVGTDGLVYLFYPDLAAVDLRRHRVVRWMTNGGSEAYTVPPVAIGGGSVLIRDYAGTVLRLDPKPGTQTYQVAWQVVEPDGTALGMHLLYDPKRQLVYLQVPADDLQPGATVALHGSSGSEAWRTPWSGGQMGLLGLDLLLRLAGSPLDTSGSAVHAQLLDRDTGVVQYDYAPSATADALQFAAGDRAGDRVYVTSNSWEHQSGSPPVARTMVTALDDHLQPLWTWTTPKAAVPYDADTGYDSTVTSRPVVGDDGSVYLTTKDCNVWALDRDGHVMWADHHPYPFKWGRALLYRGRYYAISGLWHLPASDPSVPVSFIRAYRVSPAATTGAANP